MQLTGCHNGNGMRNATCVASKTSKVPTQDTLLFISYSMVAVLRKGDLYFILFLLFQLKQNIMKTLSGINVTDMNTLLSLSGTMSTLTQNPENLSPTAQVRKK